MQSFNHIINIKFTKCLMEDPQRSLVLSWQNISLETKKGHHLLSGCSGKVGPLQMVAILGPSGAGKTTLLKVLAGRNDQGRLIGDILINGRYERPKCWHKLVGFVPQVEDYLHSNLTVRETFDDAAALRLPRTLPAKARHERVDALMHDLGLTTCAANRIGPPGRRGISGGELKRLALGIATMARPRILCLDEPTTGLDAHTALSVMRHVSRLGGHTAVLATIHQPRPSILGLFHQICLLAPEGKMVWWGSVEDAIAHFTALGHPLPVHENPAEHLIGLVKDHDIPRLRRNNRHQVDPQTQALFSAVNSGGGGPRLLDMIHRDCDGIVDQLLEAQVAAYKAGHQWPAPWWREFLVLLRRNWRVQFRDRHYIGALVGTTLFISLLAAFTFFQLPTDRYEGVEGRRGFAFFLPSEQVFTIVTVLVIAIAPGRSVWKAERASGAYRLSSAYAALFLASLPLRLALVVVRALMVYWIVGFRTDGFQYFLIFLGILLVHGICAVAYAILAHSFHGNPGKALAIATLYNFAMNLFGGNFANSVEVTWILRWIQFISPTFYAFEGLIQNELAGQTFDGVPGSFYLRLYAFDIVPIVGCVGALAGLTVAYLLIGYAILHVRTKPHKIE